MGQKSLPNILSVLQSPVSVPYTKPYAWRDQKITTARCSSKKTKEIRDVPYWRATPEENQWSFGGGVSQYNLCLLPRHNKDVCRSEEILVSINTSPNPESAEGLAHQNLLAVGPEELCIPAILCKSVQNMLLTALRTPWSTSSKEGMWMDHALWACWCCNRETLRWSTCGFQSKKTSSIKVLIPPGRGA